MEEHEDYTKIPLTDENGYPDRSGCGTILIVLAIIFIFWMVVGGVYLFT